MPPDADHLVVVLKSLNDVEALQVAGIRNLNVLVKPCTCQVSTIG